MYWDGETTPSVETPIGDFFGLGNGDLLRLAIAPALARQRQRPELLLPHALRASRPHHRHQRGEEVARSTSTATWTTATSTTAARDTLCFHAQYRQAQPSPGGTGQWYENGDPIVNYRRNLDGKDNYVWFEAKGHGQYVGVTMSVLQNQDVW